MNSLQKLLVNLLPRSWAKDMEAQSRAWMIRCPCGYEQSVWEAGGIRWKAAGTPKSQPAEEHGAKKSTQKHSPEASQEAAKRPG